MRPHKARHTGPGVFGWGARGRLAAVVHPSVAAPTQWVVCCLSTALCSRRSIVNNSCVELVCDMCFSGSRSTACSTLGQSVLAVPGSSLASLFRGGPHGSHAAFDPCPAQAGPPFSRAGPWWPVKLWEGVPPTGKLEYHGFRVYVGSKARVLLKGCPAPGVWGGMAILATLRFLLRFGMVSVAVSSSSLSYSVNR